MELAGKVWRGLVFAGEVAAEVLTTMFGGGQGGEGDEADEGWRRRGYEAESAEHSTAMKYETVRSYMAPAEHNGWGTLPDYSITTASNSDTCDMPPAEHNAWGTMPDYSVPTTSMGSGGGMFD
jgi:hypothetical protein